MSNGVNVLNVIRQNASAVYQERIPEATADNLHEVGEAILTFEAQANEFVNALINRIGLVIINNRMASNPLAPLKKGRLAVGETIEELFIDVIKAQTYDPRAAQNTLFKRHLPNVLSVFHTVNSELNYPITISNEQLRKAFMSYDGLDRFISGLIDSMYKSATLDEFVLMKQLISEWGQQGRFIVEPITAVTDEASAKEAMIKIKAVSDGMTIFSNGMNYAGVWTNTPKDEQYLITTPEFNARLDVDVLAAAFNMDKASFAGHVIVVDNLGDLGNSGIEAILVDKNWYQVYDYLRTFKTAYNGEGLYWNYFYHVWMVYSLSPFANAVAFAASTPVVSAITVTPDTATVKAGGSIQLNVSVTGTGDPTSKCTYAISGATDDETIVTPMGKVILGTNEVGTNGVITVTATSVQDSTATDSCTITVRPPVPVTGVTLNKSTTTIAAGASETLVATIAPATASNKNVTWTSSAEAKATVVNGVVTGVAAGSATITVTTADGSYTDTCTVTVTGS